VNNLLKGKDLDAALDPDRYLGQSVEIVDGVVARLGA
jgi:hypothetical protein